MKEFKSLSDKRKNLRKRVRKLFNSEILDIVEKQDKEAVRLLKEGLILDDYAIGSPRGEDYYSDLIDKIMGKDLIW